MVRRHELKFYVRRAQGLGSFYTRIQCICIGKNCPKTNLLDHSILYPRCWCVMGIIMIYELLHVFKFRKTWQTAAVMASFGLYLGYLNYQEKLKFWGRDDKFIKKNLGEGINSIFFAIVVATVIRSTTLKPTPYPQAPWKKV